MGKLDEINTEMTLRETEAYLELIFDDLEDIYSMEQPPSGKAGFIWRTIWDRPRKTSPMSYYLSFKLIETLDDQKQTINDARKNTREKERKKFSSSINLLKLEKQDLLQGIEKNQEINEKLQAKVDRHRREEQRIKKQLNMLESKLKATQNPEVEALAHDVKVLFTRLRKYENIAFEDLAYYRLSKKSEEN